MNSTHAGREIRGDVASLCFLLLLPSTISNYSLLKFKRKIQSEERLPTHSKHFRTLLLL